jgi:thiopeptide-type bacteriocin biosynthesis protein
MRMPPARRTFLPGSEWLYAKLYTGTAAADRVLCSLGPVIDRALASGAASAWFFIRYHDSDWHLRLRLHGCPARLATQVLPSLHEAAAPLLADGRIWKLELGTYEREIERYGGSVGIVLAERLFYLDSRAALGILSLLEGDAGTDVRWRIALRAIDDMLDDLGLAFEDKRKLIRRSRDGLASEFQAGVLTHRALGQRYREERASLHALLDRSADGASPLAPALAVLAERSVRLREIAVDLAAAERSGELGRPVLDIAGTFVHMTVNRLLRSAVRAQEHVIYDLLDRCYESRAARAKVGMGSRAQRDS